MNRRKWQWSIYLLALVITFSACALEDDPCTTEETGYIVAVNFLTGIDAEAMSIYVNDKYVQDISPDQGESQRISQPAGDTYVIKGTTKSGATYFKDVNLQKCEEVFVRLGYKEE